MENILNKPLILKIKHNDHKAIQIVYVITNYFFLFKKGRPQTAKYFEITCCGFHCCLMSSIVSKKHFQKPLDERETSTSLSSKNNNKINVTYTKVNMNSKIMDLKNSDRETRKQLTQKLLEIKHTRSPKYKKYITELLKIRIIRDDKIIGVHHLPEEVIVKPKTRRIEIHNINGSLTETYHLVKSNLSWSENKDLDCGEVVLDLHVKI